MSHYGSLFEQTNYHFEFPEEFRVFEYLKSKNVFPIDVTSYFEDIRNKLNKFDMSPLNIKESDFV